MTSAIPLAVALKWPFSVKYARNTKKENEGETQGQAQGQPSTVSLSCPTVKQESSLSHGERSLRIKAEFVLRGSKPISSKNPP